VHSAKIQLQPAKMLIKNLSSGESGFGSNQIETNSSEKKYDHKTPLFQNPHQQQVRR
jgi:hypothetical protein